jgi:kojibiose phosphorylase
MDENGIPIVSKRLKTENMDNTQLIKQADALMLLYLLSDVYSLNTKKTNYDFYKERILHKSSLSPSIHSIIACICGDLYQAYNFFNLAMRMDISNLYNNTKEGIHGACVGGTWQAAIFGFAGVDIKKEILCINPRMPRTWKKMVFSLIWKENVLRLELTNDSIGLKAASHKKKEIQIGIFDKITWIKPNRDYIFKRKRPILAAEYYY